MRRLYLKMGVTIMLVAGLADLFSKRAGMNFRGLWDGD